MASSTVRWVNMLIYNDFVSLSCVLFASFLHRDGVETHCALRMLANQGDLFRDIASFTAFKPSTSFLLPNIAAPTTTAAVAGTFIIVSIAVDMPTNAARQVLSTRSDAFDRGQS